MSCVLNSADKKQIDLAPVYRLIATELDQVAQTLQNQLKHENPFINEVVRYCFQLGGKRLRPVLVLLSGKMFGSIRPEHILAATALEMIHTGSLIHDDILDGARFRRHLETVNLRWDSHTAVLAGDLLIVQAMKLITQCNDVQVYRLISDACFATCEGELRQIALCSHFEMTEDDYYRVVGGKTAALLKCCCQLGVYFSDADPSFVSLFEQFGHRLGVAFQIIDDILDLTGNESETGKTLGTDLLNHKPTLPLIYYLRDAEPAEKRRALALVRQENLDSETVSQICRLLDESGAVLTARQTARSLLEDALTSIQTALRDVPSVPKAVLNTEAVFDALSTIAQFVVSRKK